MLKIQKNNEQLFRRELPDSRPFLLIHNETEVKRIPRKKDWKTQTRSLNSIVIVGVIQTIVHWEIYFFKLRAKLTINQDVSRTDFTIPFQGFTSK